MMIVMKGGKVEGWGGGGEVWKVTVNACGSVSVSVSVSGSVSGR